MLAGIPAGPVAAGFTAAGTLAGLGAAPRTGSGVTTSAGVGSRVTDGVVGRRGIVRGVVGWVVDAGVVGAGGTVGVVTVIGDDEVSGAETLVCVAGTETVEAVTITEGSAGPTWVITSWAGHHQRAEPRPTATTAAAMIGSARRRLLLATVSGGRLPQTGDEPTRSGQTERQHKCAEEHQQRTDDRGRAGRGGRAVAAGNLTWERRLR